MGLVASTTPSDSKESSANDWPTKHVCQNFSERTQLNRRSRSRKLRKLRNLVIEAYECDVVVFCLHKYLAFLKIDLPVSSNCLAPVWWWSCEVLLARKTSRQLTTMRGPAHIHRKWEKLINFSRSMQVPAREEQVHMPPIQEGKSFNWRNVSPSTRSWNNITDEFNMLTGKQYSWEAPSSVTLNLRKNNKLAKSLMMLTGLSFTSDPRVGAMLE